MFGMRDHLISPVHDRLRRHRHREPLSEQHRHVPQGQGAGRDRRLRARVWRRAAIRSRPISAAARDSSSMPRSAPSMPSSGRRARVPASFRCYAAWNNGLKVTATGGEDSMSERCTAIKLVGADAHLRVHRLARPRHGRVVRGDARRTRVRHDRSARRAHRQWDVAW